MKILNTYNSESKKRFIRENSETITEYKKIITLFMRENSEMNSAGLHWRL